MFRAFAVAGAVLLSMATEALTQHEHRSGSLGVVAFPTSCSPAIQKDFERGVALLHSFAYEDSTAAFIAIEKKDPGCGMAYWGEAMSYYHQVWEPPDAHHLKNGLTASKKAVATGAKTLRERDYIAAIFAFYDGPAQRDHKVQALKYQSAMEHLYQLYPDDGEAAVFYALSLIASASTEDANYTDKRKAGAILEKVFAEQPEHPGVAHYLIHTYDNPVLAPRALNAARRYAQIAPASVHALHMPSHIFIQVGSWQEAIDSNRASVAAARKYSAKHPGEGIWDMEAHAQDYLAYAYLQIGRDRDAKRVLDEVSTASNRRFGESAAASYSAFAGIPARYTLERKQWTEACALADHKLPHPIYEAETYFARAVGCARSGKLAPARKALEQLAKLLQGPIPATTYSDPNFIEIPRQEAASWLAAAEGKPEEALRLMRSAVEREQSTKATWVPAPVLPAAEQLGDLLLQLNRPQEALAAFQTALNTTPNRFNRRLRRRTRRRTGRGPGHREDPLRKVNCSLQRLRRRSAGIGYGTSISAKAERRRKPIDAAIPP